MRKFEGPYRVLEVRNNNLTFWKKGRRVTVNIDQVRAYHPRHSDTNSFDSTNETLYDGKGSNNGSSRSNPGKSRRSRKPSVDKRSEHRDRKRQAPLLPRGIKRTIPSSVSSRNHKYRRNNFNRSQGPETISGPSHQQQMRQFSPTKEESRRGARVHSDKARETRITSSKGHSAAEGRQVRSGKTTTVRHCPYYLRNRFKEPEGILEEHWDRQSTAEQPQEKEPQHGSLRRRSG
ncbi:uncharacterized protein TNCV_3300031 [Trichonephila clavipes]|nr:uncharacterized protein TNCV_3300031 [Trichonephila clavipes]